MRNSSNMTAAHFVWLASVFKQFAPSMAYDEYARIVRDAAADLDVANPRFDKARFLAACDVG